MKLKKPFRMPIIVRSEIITYEEGRGTGEGRIITKDLVWIPLKFWHYLMKHRFRIRNASSHPLLTLDFIEIIIPELGKE